MTIKTSSYSNIIAVTVNLALAYLAYLICRIAYVWENWDLFAPGWDQLSFAKLMHGSFVFDSSAIFYTNTLYAILMLMPILAAQRRWWQVMTRWFFFIINSLAVIINLCDAVYSQFTGRRTTSTFFHEFSNEGNLGSIFFTELLNHWYLVLLGAALIAMLWLLYTKTAENATNPNHKQYYWTQSVALTLFLALSFTAIRGGTPWKVLRPVNLGSANNYVNQPHEAAIVLNTPFTLIRTVGKTTFSDPGYFDTNTLAKIYTPVHTPACDSATVSQRKNIVVIIVESFAREYTGFYNRTLENGNYKGYTPFVDSLLGVSLTWEHTFANGRKSIDAMPSILASIPMFVEPFYMTGYSLNRVSGLPAELAKEGYSSAFFHGAENGSMGFQDFAHSIGFQKYYGRTEYDADTRFNGEEDFDGTWAIWDEPFLQFFATKMSEMQEPFVTAVFTASSHHPFVIPEEYRDIYPEEEMVMHKCIRYTDNALRRFFATAAKQEWFKNTIFVLCNDHTNMTNHDLYRTPIGVYSGPVLIFDPSGSLPRGVMKGIAQQIDIMPTLLGIVQHPYPFVAFGQDLLNTHPDSTWTVNYNSGIYQYLCGDTLIQFDGEHIVGTYDLRNDPLMRHPLHSKPAKHENKLKAIVQQYMKRMAEDKLTL